MSEWTAQRISFEWTNGGPWESANYELRWSKFSQFGVRNSSFDIRLCASSQARQHATIGGSLNDTGLVDATFMPTVRGAASCDSI